jgi:hypothetical protein
MVRAEQFRVMVFAQMTYRKTSRDIERPHGTAGKTASHGISVGD